MNVGMFAGRIGGDPRMNSIAGQQGPTSVLNFSLAVDKRQKGQDGKPLTLWIDCSLWGTRADALAPYIKKGGYVTVTGDVDVEMFQGQNGAGCKMTCRVNDLKLQGSAQPQGQQSAAPAPAQQAYNQRPQQQSGYKNGAATPNMHNPAPAQRTAEPVIDFEDENPF